jgi:hypothetical protein
MREKSEKIGKPQQHGSIVVVLSPPLLYSSTFSLLHFLHSLVVLLFVHIIIILAVAVVVVVRLVMRSWLVIALVVCVFGVSVAVGYSGSAQEHRDLERLNEIFDKFRAFAAAPLTQTAPDPAQFQNGTHARTHTHTHTHSRSTARNDPPHTSPPLTACSA